MRLSFKQKLFIALFLNASSIFFYILIHDVGLICRNMPLLVPTHSSGTQPVGDFRLAQPE